MCGRICERKKKNERRLIAKSSEEKLRKKLIKFYATQEDDQYIQKYAPNSVTLETIFYDWLKVKESHTNSGF